MATAFQTVQLGLVITNTLATALNIELFQYNASQTRVYNSQVNNYYPLAVDPTNPDNGAVLISVPGMGGATFNLYGYLAGAFDVQNTGAANHLPTGNTRNVVFFGQDGSLTYQPGYVAGALPSGKVTVQTTNATYRQFFEWSGNNNWMLDNARILYSDTNSINNPIYHTKNLINGRTSSDNVTPQTFASPQDYQSLKVDVPMGFLMTPDYGLQYVINPVEGGGAPNIITMNLFFRPQYPLPI